MSDDKQFERWKRARTDGEVPEGFTDRVMARIEEREAAHRDLGVLFILSEATRSRPGLAVATVLAAAIFLYRAACGFGVLITG